MKNILLTKIQVNPIAQMCHRCQVTLNKGMLS